MKEIKMLEILKRIEICLKRDSLYESKEYIKIEIENLKGITQEKCKSKFYYCDNYYCIECHNLNCMNKEIV